MLDESFGEVAADENYPETVLRGGLVQSGSEGVGAEGHTALPVLCHCGIAQGDDEDKARISCLLGHAVGPWMLLQNSLAVEYHANLALEADRLVVFSGNEIPHGLTEGKHMRNFLKETDKEEYFITFVVTALIC